MAFTGGFANYHESPSAHLGATGGDPSRVNQHLAADFSNPTAT